MQVVMLSNYLNHHVLPICLAFRAMPDVQFVFIATEPVSEKRLALGYKDIDHMHSFVLCAYDNSENEAKAIEICQTCDILIVGGASERYVRVREQKKKLTFFYSERLFKEKGFSWKTIPRWFKYVLKRPFYKNAYLLCASAFAAEDYAKTGNFKGRAFRWGYFPEVKRLDIDARMQRKEQSVPSLLWVGRMIDWKHPEAAIIVARRLKEAGYAFQLNVIGNGEMLQSLQNMVKENHLQESVHLLGAMPPAKVREYMESSNVFLFTSDCGEGWGAVLNEAMNAGCAVVAADQIGSVPYLLKNEDNGLIFESENWDDLYKKVEALVQNRERGEHYGRAAYRTMIDTWNAEVAAQRFIETTRCMQSGYTTPFDDGPCSKVL